MTPADAHDAGLGAGLKMQMPPADAEVKMTPANAQNIFPCNYP